MPIRETEAIILRSYPLREAGKIVSFFSRGGGRLRGIAPSPWGDLPDESDDFHE